MGSSLNSEIQEAWDAAQSAAQRYGDFVTAIMGGIENEIASITQQIESLDKQISNLGNNTSNASTQRPTTIAPTTQPTQPSEADMAQAKNNMVSDIVSQMKAKSLTWHTASDTTKQAIANEGLQLGNSLASLGVSAERDNNGVWWIRSDSLNPSYVGKKLYDCYHTGGRVGEEPLKPNEEFVKAEKGEFLMTANQQDSLSAQIDRIQAMAKAAGILISNQHDLLGAQIELIQGMSKAFESYSFMDFAVASKNPWPNGVVEGGSSSISNITNHNQPVEIRMGDITITAPSGDGKIIADEVRKITRENMNQIGSMLRR